MKKSNTLIIIGISLLILFLLGQFLFGSKKSFSENENRYLEHFPKWSFKNIFSGKYQEQLESYITDHFPNRDRWVNINAKTMIKEGQIEIRDVYLGQEKYLLKRYHSFTQKEKLVSQLNKFYQTLNYTNMSLMLVPTSITINQDKLPKYAITDSEEKDINDIYYHLTFNSIPIIEPLQKGNKEYPMFYRLDHHWTSYGAYYAYLEYCKKNDLKPMDINAYDIKEVSNTFKGTLYSKTGLYQYPSDKIHVFLPSNPHYQVNYVSEEKVTNTLYEEKYLHQKDQYSYFLDNNHPLIEITNLDSSNTSEIMVIKDSFANSFIPFLLGNYAKVHVIDPRFYKDSISKYVKQHTNIKDVLILYSIQSLEDNLGLYQIK